MAKGAGAGAKPKAGPKRHRNAQMRDDIVLSSAPRTDPIPDPSFPLDGVRREVWDRMWTHPIAVLWIEADCAALTRMVVLQTTPSSFDDRGLLAEMRQLEDRYLLNPYSRVQQRVKFAGAEAGEEGTASVSDISAWRERIEGTG